MGFFSNLFGGTKNTVSQTPHIPSILPDIAKNEINSGRLPHINTDKLFLKRGEICHYTDWAMIEVTKKKRVVHSHRDGFSTPGFFKGNRYNTGWSTSTVDEQPVVNHYKGILYITNRRIIFSSKEYGVDKSFQDLSLCNPYANAVELQYGSNMYMFFVPDGNLVYKVIKMLQ